jgi:hypothetical protein
VTVTGKAAGWGAVVATDTAGVSVLSADGVALVDSNELAVPAVQADRRARIKIRDSSKVDIFLTRARSPFICPVTRLHHHPNDFIGRAMIK